MPHSARHVKLNYHLRPDALAVCPAARVVEVPVGVDTAIFSPEATGG